MLITYGSICVIVIAGSVIENRCRVAGNTVGALAARRVTRYFAATVGIVLAIGWLQSAVELLSN